MHGQQKDSDRGQAGPEVHFNVLHRAAEFEYPHGQPQNDAVDESFSKKAENHAHMMAIYFMHYNFVRIHQTLKITPAMAAGVTSKLWETSDMVAVLEDWESAWGRKCWSREWCAQRRRS
jgi:hypothetical protein